MKYLDTRPWAKTESAFPKAFSGWVDLQLHALGHVPEHKVLKDWGVGKGDFFLEFRRRGYLVSGYDIDPRMSRVEPRDFTMMIVTPQEETDVAICRNVLEHLPDPTHLLKAIRTNLEPGGFAVISVPDWPTYAPIFYRDHTHVRPYQLEGLVDLMIESGFDVVSAQRIVQYAPCLESRLLRVCADVCTVVLPVRWAQALADATGWEFFRWACLRTAVVFARKPLG